jgi:hypothetical protein
MLVLVVSAAALTLAVSWFLASYSIVMPMKVLTKGAVCGDNRERDRISICTQFRLEW